MRSLIQLVVVELEGVGLLALNLFDERGQHADQVIRIKDDDLAIIDAVVETMVAHRIETVDLMTDSEDVFKQFIAVPGVNTTLVSSADLAALYEVLTSVSPVFPILQELYLKQPKDQVTKKAEPPVSWRRRFFNYIKNLLKRGNEQ